MNGWTEVLKMVKNKGRENILSPATSYYLVMANTCFKKEDEHLNSYRFGLSFTQITFSLTRRLTEFYVKNVK